MSADDVTTTTTSTNEGRKSSKPVMEKRRRARINACLVELQSLLADVIKSEGAIKSKMEKADILEMTVRHLRQLQHKSTTQGLALPTSSTTLGDTSKFRLGYAECINEVSKFLNSIAMEEVDLKSRIMDHLATCTNISPNLTPLPSKQSSSEMLRPCQLPYQVSQSVFPTPEAVPGHPVSTGSNVTKSAIRIKPKSDINCKETKTTDINLNITTANTIESMCSRDMSSSKDPVLQTKDLTVKQVSGNGSCIQTCGNDTQVVYDNNLGKVTADSTSPSKQDFMPMHPVQMPVFSTVQIVPASIGGSDFALVLPTGIVSANTCLFPSPTPQNYILPVFPQQASIVSTSISTKPNSTSMSSSSTVARATDSLNGTITNGASSTTTSSPFKAKEQENLNQALRHQNETFVSRFHPYKDRKQPLSNIMEPKVTSTITSFVETSQSPSFKRDLAVSSSSGSLCQEISNLKARPSSKVIIKPSQNHDSPETVGNVSDGVVQNQQDQNDEGDMWRPW